MTTKLSSAYEVHNPSFNDMNIEQQIEAGINDWCAEGWDGHPFFGRTKAEAEANRAPYVGATPRGYIYLGTDLVCYHE